MNRDCRQAHGRHGRGARSRHGLRSARDARGHGVRHARGRAHHGGRRRRRTSRKKRESITMHASQVTDSTFFLRMPPEVFAHGVRRPSGSSARARRQASTKTSSPACEPAHPRPPRPCRRRMGRRPRSRSRRARPRAGGGDGRSGRTARPAPHPRQPDAALPRDGGAARTALEREPRPSTPRSARSPRRPSVAMEQRTPWLRRCDGRHVGGSRRRRYSVGAMASWRGSRAIDDDTVVVSHFVAINAAIGAALGDRPDRDRRASTTARRR